MAKIRDYAQVVKAKLADLFVIDTIEDNTHKTKSVSVQQIGSAVNTEQTFSDLISSDKTIVGAINEVGSIQETASGAVASFDTSLAIPFKACNCEIPYDANGYTGLKIGYVDWNQKCYGLRINRSTLSSTVNSTEDITCTSTGSQKSFGFVYQDNDSNNYSFIKDHIYYYSTKITATNISNFTRYVYTGTMGAITPYYYITSGVCETIGKPTANGAQSFNASTSNDSLSTNDNFTFNSVQIVDLTQVFGDTIAQMIYDLESNTEGAGVALYKSIFYKNFYGYSEGGSLVTVNSVNGDTNCPNASIDFNTTIYGGSLDVTNGKLTDKYNADGTEKTPVEIDVTPTTISAVSGHQNNIFSTAQGNNEVTYLETIKEYIDKVVSNL